MAAALSANWLAFQQSQKKPTVKRKRDDDESNSTVESNWKHKRERSLERIVSKVVEKNAKKGKKQSREDLLKWADDNDIPLEDLKKAYGPDVVQSRGKRSAKSATAHLFAAMGADEKTAGKDALKVWSNRPVEVDETKTAIGKYVSLDCEFVGVGHEGKRSVLARVSIVNYYGAVVMDEFVRPEEKVTDWRTWVSGIRPSDMQNAKSFKEVQYKVADILKDRVLVGHAVSNDLKVLMIAHPKRLIRDTSKHAAFRKISKGRAPSLKKVAKEFLGIDIQGDEHSSIEDARACILLFRQFKDDFQKLEQANLKKAKGAKENALVSAIEEA
ncbi:ribonuclease H-like domain-containing protein [Lipomyces chichibuensis]|uniref:ribonuclease H-like domain-containing protein n=1 Tax=Lipomyces chichibuensis TaxID=1546026 RepID=UPI0033443966